MDDLYLNKDLFPIKIFPHVMLEENDKIYFTSLNDRFGVLLQSFIYNQNKGYELASLCVARTLVETIMHTICYDKPITYEQDYDKCYLNTQLQYCIDNECLEDLFNFFSYLSEHAHTNSLGTYSLYVCKEDETYVYLSNNSNYLRTLFNKEVPETLDVLIEKYIQVFDKKIEHLVYNTSHFINNIPIIVLPKNSNSIFDVYEILEILRIKLIDKIEKNKQMYGMEALLQSMLYRCCDLADAFLANYKDNLWLGAYSIVRSLIDTIISFVQYRNQFSVYLKNKNIKECKKLNENHILAERTKVLRNTAK